MKPKTMGETRWFIMKTNEKTINILLVGLVFIQTIIFGIAYLLNNHIVNNILPVILILFTLAYSLYFSKNFKEKQTQKKEDIQKLVSFLENPMAVAYTDQITEEFLPVFQAIKEFKFKHNRIITDFTETTATIAENNNNILDLIGDLSKFLKDFDNNLNSLNDSLLLVAHIDMSYGEKEVASFLKVNVELEHFKGNLNDFASLLKQVYSMYINDTENNLQMEEKLLKDISEIQHANTSQLTKNKEELNQFSKDITDLNSDINNFSTKISAIVEIKNLIQFHSGLFFEMSNQITELENNVEEKIHEIENSVNSLDEISEKSRLLALNASIYAAEAGEHGKGFSIIASEMKKLAESSLYLHTKIRKTTTSVDGKLDNLKECNNNFLDRKIEITEGIENLTQLSSFMISFSQQLSNKIFDSERLLKRIVNSVDKIQDRIEMATQKINPAIANCREKLYSLGHTEDLKIRIDKTLVSIADFNKKMNHEIPDVFQTLNSIFEKTSVTYSNFVLIKDNVEQFLRDSAAKKAQQFRFELEGDNVRLFKDSVKILNKSHKALKKIIE